MLLAILITLLGILLSAFFSGSETGFYRVTRVRLATDAKSGKWIARALHWLVGHSSLVVATVLIGNNIANYLVSFGLILLSHQLFQDSNQAEAILPLLMTPVLFIYGELLPKYLYYQVPYRLLRLSAPLMLLFTLLFAPVSIIVMLLERIWQRALGITTSQATSPLERQELQRVLVEGQEAGVVLPIQRELAQNLFTYGVRPIRQFAIPLRGIASVEAQASKQTILQQADKFGQSIVGVLHADRKQIIGCHRVADVLVAEEEIPPHLPIHIVQATESSIQVLTRLHCQHCPLAQVVDSNQRVLGIVTRERLTSLLLSES